MTGSAVSTPAAERRAFEVRRASVSAGRLAGLAAPFGVTITHGGSRERIAPSAFATALRDGRDILALADHDPAKVIGRTASGRLVLSETDEGLAFELDVADTAAGRDVLALAESGDLGGVSIGFALESSAWRIERDAEGPVTVYEAVDLREVSIIAAWPAYGTTHASKRARLAEIAGDEANARARRRRAYAVRLAEVGRVG